MIFPEGTNLTKETIEKSNNFALENNLKPYTQVLHPRTTGFIHLFNEMHAKNIIDCVQDVTIAYRGGKIPENESDFLYGNLPDEIHFYLDKFDSNLLIKGESPYATLLENWINERWNIKENFLKEYVLKDLINLGFLVIF